MAEFDPDQYLSGGGTAVAEPPAFNPDQYLAQPQGGFDPDQYLRGAAELQQADEQQAMERNAASGKGHYLDALAIGLDKARNIGTEALSAFSPEMSARVFGQTTESLRPNEIAPPLISPEAARQIVGTLPEWAGGNTQFGQGVSESAANALSSFSAPGALAQLPAFALPGVSEVYVMNLLSELPDQGRKLLATAHQYGWGSKETGKLAAEYGITDLTGFLAGKHSTLKRGIVGELNARVGEVPKVGGEAGQAPDLAPPETPPESSPPGPDVVPETPPASSSRPPVDISTAPNVPIDSQPEITAPGPDIASTDPTTAGTSNRVFGDIYGEDAIPPGQGVDTAQLLDNARASIRTGAVDPYAILSETLKRGIANKEEFAVLSAEHERLVSDAVAKQKASDPSAPEAARRAEEFANAIQPHKTAASDLMRLFQGELNYDLSTPFGMEQYMKAELGRGMKPSERPAFEKRALEIRLGENGVQRAIASSDMKVRRHYAKVLDIPMEEAASRVREWLKDCQV